MRKLVLAAFLSVFAASAWAADSCEKQADTRNNGKPLAGAARTSFVKKCQADMKADCEKKAVSKDGKPLAGAAKNSSVKACMSGA